MPGVKFVVMYPRPLRLLRYQDPYRILYLKGRYYWNKRTPEGVRRGLEYFREAGERSVPYPFSFASADAGPVSHS
jgi:hypothetical protein